MKNGPFELRVLDSLPRNAYWELHPPLRVEMLRMRGVTKTLEEVQQAGKQALGEKAPTQSEKAQEGCIVS